jgi:PBSX family phage terminase large subunit
LKITLHKFQETAFTSTKKVTVSAAGIQSGKSLTGAIWIIARAASINPDDNLIICAPTYKILSQATIRTFLKLAKDMGTYHKVDAIFKFHHGPTVYIRSLTDPNAMEGITDVEGAWLDEGGLISRYAYENVEGRCAFRSAPIMITTTPYSLNWLYQAWKDWKKDLTPDTEFIIYRSIDNPYFPQAEYDRQKRKLDPVRFAMKYMGQFGQMEGLVYPNLKFIRARPLPTGTKYYGGIDWGFTNPFALTIRAVTPDGLQYRVGEYYKSGLTVEEQIQAVKSRHALYNFELFIADPSNPAAIKAFNQAGLRCIGGKNDIVEGIDKHRELINSERYFVFEEENPYGFDEYQSYHYPEPKDLKIDEDEKEQVPVDKNNHSIDADRYVTMYLTQAVEQRKVPVTPSSGDKEPPNDALKRLNWLKKGGSSRYKNIG